MKNIKALLIVGWLFALTSLPAAAVPDAPTLSDPPNGFTMLGWGVGLSWRYNGDTATTYHLQVTPANNDGAGIDLITNAQHNGIFGLEEIFDIPAPPTWYGLLPDMTYTWRVRAGDGTNWSAWSLSRTFSTAFARSDNITAVSPVDGVTISSLTPSVRWNNPAKEIFYYEVQISKDPQFRTVGVTSAPVYWNLVHGGVSNPSNSYAVPVGYPLEAGKTYYWRVRPRVQGDGRPVDWSQTWSFTTPESWVPIAQGSCPSSHIVKANPDSMIYHLPGNSSYDRTTNPRVKCYIDAQTAERDGFRPAEN